MNFASKYVWDSGSDVSEESIEHDELHEEDDIDEDLATPAGEQELEAASSSKVGFLARLFSKKSKDRPAKKQKKVKITEPKRKGGKGGKVHRVRKADCNVLAVCMDQLVKDDANLFTGEPVHCAGCNAVLSAASRVIWANPEDPATSDATWACEFCSHTNDAMALHPEEVPAGEAVDYIIEPAPEASTGTDNGNVVFCVDISGSMCVTTPINGQIKISEAQRRQREKLMAFNDDHSHQRLPSEAKGVSYISRLQCMQSAVSSQIEALAKDHSESRAGIVSFSNEVDINGREIITGDKLHNYEKVKEVGIGQQLDKSVSANSAQLLTRVADLEEGGQTALGPALLASVAMASNTPGSKVILCTDGLANVGLGSLDHDNDDSAQQVASEFYQRVGLYAKENDVAVSILTLKGTTCSVEDVGQVPDLTGGDVDIVDPLDLGANFDDILANPVIATKVRCEVLLHAGLKFRNQAQENAVGDAGDSKDKAPVTAVNKVVTDIGNVTAETMKTFEFEKNRHADGVSIAGLSKVPFQAQIYYTRRDGARCLRVITRHQDITADRTKAEDELDVAVVGANAVQQSARLVSEGNYTKAKLKHMKATRLIERTLVRGEEMPHVPKEQQQRQQDQYRKYKQSSTSWGNHLSRAVVDEDLDDDNDFGSDSDSSGSFGRIRAKNSQSRVMRTKARKSKRAKQDSFAQFTYATKSAKKSSFW